jgi:very-short-patch-repair endonuclease
MKKITGKESIEFTLKYFNQYKYEKEYLGIPGRKYRFDYCIPSEKLAIEYEGVFTSGKSRHTNVMGYTGDCEKYNLAVINGWRVLRYTAKNVGQLFNDLRKLLTTI